MYYFAICNLFEFHSLVRCLNLGPGRMEPEVKINRVVCQVIENVLVSAEIIFNLRYIFIRSIYNIRIVTRVSSKSGLFVSNLRLKPNMVNSAWKVTNISYLFIFHGWFYPHEYFPRLEPGSRLIFYFFLNNSLSNWKRFILNPRTMINYIAKCEKWNRKQIPLRHSTQWMDPAEKKLRRIYCPICEAIKPNKTNNKIHINCNTSIRTLHIHKNYFDAIKNNLVFEDNLNQTTPMHSPDKKPQ